MADAITPGDDWSVSEARKSHLFWISTMLGVATGLFAVLVSLRVGLLVLERHFSLLTVLWDIRYYLESFGDIAGFALLYAVVPIVWVGVSSAWWLKRLVVGRRVGGPVVCLFVIPGIFGAWAWFVTALRQIRWTFGLREISGEIGSFGIREADLLEPLIVAGLSCLIGLVFANVVLMHRETARR